MGGLVAWQSKLQPTISLSTTEAEYQAATGAVKEALWMKNFIDQLLNPEKVEIIVQVDNQSALRLLKNPQSVSRAKHIDVQHHFLRERAIREEVVFRYCPTEKMWADYHTKGLPKEKFKTFISKLGMYSPEVELSWSVERTTLSEGNSLTLSDQTQSSTKSKTRGSPDEDAEESDIGLDERKAAQQVHSTAKQASQ